MKEEKDCFACGKILILEGEIRSYTHAHVDPKQKLLYNIGEMGEFLQISNNNS